MCVCFLLLFVVDKLSLLGVCFASLNVLLVPACFALVLLGTELSTLISELKGRNLCEFGLVWCFFSFVLSLPPHLLMSKWRQQNSCEVEEKTVAGQSSFYFLL